MAMFGSASVTITIDDGPAGSGQAVTGFVREINGVKVESHQARTEAFGDTWEETTPTGMKKINPLTIKGFYDDTATSGPHVVFRSPDVNVTSSSRTVVIVFGGTNGTATFESRLISYEVSPKNGNLTEYEAVLQPTGSLAWS